MAKNQALQTLHALRAVEIGKITELEEAANRLRGKLEGIDQAIAALGGKRIVSAPPAGKKNGGADKRPCGDIVIELLMNHPDGIALADLWTDLHQRHPEVPKTTMYGAAKRLRDAKKIAERDGKLYLPIRE